MMALQPEGRQRHEIQNQLSSFLKRVRQREQEHHKLCDYTNRLLTRQTEFERTLYIQDQISKTNLFLKEHLNNDLQCQQTDFGLASNCQLALNEEEQNILGRRVVSRVLEVTFAAIETFREFRQYYSAKYLKFKEKCLKIVSEGGSKTSLAVRLTSRYLSQKKQTEVERLKQVIKCFQASNYDLFPHLKSSYYQLLLKKDNFETETPTSFLGPVNLWKRQERLNPEKQKYKELRVRTMSKSSREEKQKNRKAELKKIKKYVSLLWEVMDVEKDDLIDQLAPENKQWVSKRILNCLLTRNKHNHHHMKSFQEKQEQFEEVKKHPPPKPFIKIQRCLSLEQELLENSEEETEADKFIQNTFTIKDIRISQSSLPKKEDNAMIRYQRRQTARNCHFSGKQMQTERKKRITFNNIEGIQKKRKQKDIFSSQKQIGQQQNIVEVSLKGAIRLPRARFPEITPRTASVSKSKLLKQQQATLRTKLQIKPSSSSYFQQIQKRIVKFCQMKRNLVI